MELRVGMLAKATDGPGGEIADVVVDPVTWHVTHLVLQPHHRHDQARLVPMDAVVSRSRHPRSSSGRTRKTARTRLSPPCGSMRPTAARCS